MTSIAKIEERPGKAAMDAKPTRSAFRRGCCVGVSALRGSAFALAMTGMLLQPAAALAQTEGAGPSVAAGIAPDQPRKLSGIWKVERFIFRIPDAPMLPSTEAVIDRQVAAMNGGQVLYTAWTSCRPGSPSAMVMPMNSLVVLEGASDITISFEEPRMTRRIRMNADHPAELQPSYLGDSVGHWDGDTLVIDTVGFNGKFQLDAYGLPTGEQLHTVERLTKSADGTKITIQTTFEDPEYFSAPFTIERAWVPNGARHQFEYDCMENPRQEEFAHTYYIQDLYRPACVRFAGEGEEPSKILCRRPEEQAEKLVGIAEHSTTEK